MIQGGEVRYVVYIGGVQQAQAGLNQMEQSANRAERGITNLNGALRKMAGSVGMSTGAIDAAARSLGTLSGGLRAVGIALSAQALYNFGKEAVETAADYETAVKRIMFASENFAEGQKNIAFITAEAERYKIPIQEATDSYGKFLAMLAGSDIASDKIRNLHDQLLLIGKVKGLADGQLDAAVMNLGKMLEAGGLDARHFRPLEQQLSGIGAFVAKELGMTVHQLALLRNQGKLTTVDPQVLLVAIEKMAASLRQFEPESTQTIRSGLNDVSNAWLTFKNSLVLDNKQDIIELFGTLKDGVKYLADHKDEIVAFAHTVVGLAKAWLAYSAIMKVTELTLAFTVAAGTATSAIAAQNAALITEAELVAALAVEYDALVVSMSGLYGAEKAAFMATAANAFNLTPNMAGVAASGAAGAAGAGAAITKGIGAAVLPVAVMYFAGEALAALLPKGTFGQSKDGKNLEWWEVFDRITARTDRLLQYQEDSKYAQALSAGTAAYGTTGGNLTAELLGLGKPGGVFGYVAGKPVDPKALAAAQAAGKIKPPTDHVTGQRVVTYNFHIKEINGIKENIVNEGGKMDEEDFAERMKQVILSTLRDSHIDYR